MKASVFGDAIMFSVFNFHSKDPGSTAWVFTYRVNGSTEIGFEPEKTTPLEILKKYMNSFENSDEEIAQNYQDAVLVFSNTHRPSDLTNCSEMGVTELKSGWGGNGNVTIIGDAAHSIRPASGLGGSLAFEDAALLGRLLSGCNDKHIIKDKLREFENIRLPRCRSISNDQKLRGELSYVHGFSAIPAWNVEYEKWIYNGLDASPKPPVSESDVFRYLLSQ